MHTHTQYRIFITPSRHTYSMEGRPTTTTDDVTLLTSNGDVFKVPVNIIAKMSVTIHHLLEDLGGTKEPVRLNNVDSNTLSRVIDYCKLHMSHSTEQGYAADGITDDTVTDGLRQWEREFLAMTLSQLFDTIMAANYLNIKPLLDLTCRNVAMMIKGKTPEEIRQKFHIKNDFTPEEEEEVRRENQWAFD